MLMSTNMDHNLNQLKKEFDEAALRSDERNALKARLVSFVHENPVRPRGFFSVNFIHLPVFRLAPVALIVLFFLGGGISQVAENSLPGDILYPVKTGFNEEVRGLLETSAESVAEFETDLADRRLTELEQVTAKSETPPETVTTLEKQLQVHVDRAEKKIESAETQNKAKNKETSRIEKVKERLKNIKERRDKPRATKFEPQTFMAAPSNPNADSKKSAPALKIYVEPSRTREPSKSGKSEDASPGKNSESTPGAPDPTAVPQPMMMQAPGNTLFDAATKTSPASTTPQQVSVSLSCFKNSLGGKEYYERRIEDLRTYLGSVQGKLGDEYVNKKLDMLAEIEIDLEGIRTKFFFSDSFSGVHEGLSLIEKELLGLSCPRR